MDKTKAGRTRLRSRAELNSASKCYSKLRLYFLEDRFRNTLHADQSESGKEGDLRTLEGVFGVPAFGQGVIVFFRSAYCRPSRCMQAGPIRKEGQRFWSCCGQVVSLVMQEMPKDKREP